MDNEKIVAIALLTETHVRMLGTSLKKIFSITEDGRFDDVLKSIDDVHSAGPLR
jgi:hypothetical protein